LENYILLESLRFEGTFGYEIDIDPSLKYHDIRIPGFVLQPVVENAIQHGLIPKKGNGKLTIKLIDKETYVHCIVEDNGVGRSHTQITDPDNLRTSMGLKMLQTRLHLQNSEGHKDMLQIIDLVSDEGKPLGTRVHIKLPLQSTTDA